MPALWRTQSTRRNRHVVMSFIKGNFECDVGHIARGFPAGIRQGAFPKEVTIKSKSGTR